MFLEETTGFPQVTLQGTFHCGHIKRMTSENSEKTMTMADRFYLGGPINVRGFEMRGLGQAGWRSEGVTQSNGNIFDFCHWSSKILKILVHIRCQN